MFGLSGGGGDHGSGMGVLLSFESLLQGTNVVKIPN